MPSTVTDGSPARESAPEAWARCIPHLQAALEHAGGTHGIEDVARLVGQGRAQFWPGARCAVVTEFYDYPKLRACNVWLLGGDLTELLDMLPAIEAWARGQGCARMLGGGPRAGWGRVLAPRGYRPGWTLYCKDFTS
jgi:GNAT superfamily N-acetyltransferase